MGAVMVDRLRERAEEAQRQAERLQKMVELAQGLGDEGLRELVTLLTAEEHSLPHTNGNGNGNGNGHKPPQAKTGAPRGRDAVRLIVRRRPGVWTLTELRAEMEREGWYTSASGLEAAAKRLCDKNGEGRRVGRGRYVFPADYRGEDAIESDPSDGATIPLIPVTG